MDKITKPPVHPLTGKSRGKDREHESCENAGQYFKQIRTRRNRTLKDVASVLRVQPHHIACIEAGGLPDPPGFPYALGMVRSYARYLGMDAEPMVKVYKPQDYLKQGGKHSVYLHQERPSFRWKFVVALLVVMMAWGGWHYYGHLIFPSDDYTVKQSFQNNNPEPSSENYGTLSESGEQTDENDTVSVFSSDIYANRWHSPSLVYDGQDGSLVLATTDTAVALGMWDEREKMKADIVLEATDDCWIEIAERDNGKVVLARLLRSGQRMHLDDVGTMVLSVGNAGGVAMYWNGHPLRRIGGIGQFVQNVSLDPAQLLRKIMPGKIVPAG